MKKITFLSYFMNYDINLKNKFFKTMLINQCGKLYKKKKN